MMSKKKKKNQGLKKDTKLFLIIGLCFIVVGIICIILGPIVYKGVSYDDKRFVEGTITSVDKIRRNLVDVDKKVEEAKGRSEDEYMYEWKVQYSLIVDDKEYTYDDTLDYYIKGNDPKVGDKRTFSIAVTDDGIIYDPQDADRNHLTGGGVLAIIVSGFFFILAFIKQKVL